MKHIKYLLACTACLLATAAWSQWQWIDKDGRKVFSDRAPASSVPDKNILQRPGEHVTAAPAAAVEAPSADSGVKPAPAAGAQAPQISRIDPELAEKKKMAEEAEVAKRKAEETHIAKVRAENCGRAKQAKASFDSGVRIARTNAKGEREILDDTARAAETKRIASIIESDCQ